jgi:hypothetical protein
MQDNSKTIAAVAIALLVGGVLGYLVCCGGEDHHEGKGGDVMGQQNESHMMESDSLEDSHHMMMDDSLMNKTGDDFDKTFLEQMIIHHEGALQMAEMAMYNSNHLEIQELASQIQQSQAAEIAQMQAWYEQWFAQPVHTDDFGGFRSQEEHDAMPHTH